MASVREVDVLIIGSGHNGLVAAILLAREGLKVHVVEEKNVVGGCVRTEYPFKSAPNLGCSTGAYLLGLMPPELIQKLGIDIPYMRRDPHYFLPTIGKGFLLAGSNREEMKKQFVQFFSLEDWEANSRLEAELDAFREDLGKTWLEEPLSIEETAEKYVRPELRQVFIDLCRKPVRDYIERFNFKSNTLKAMYAVTDGFSGLNAGYDTPGTGMNFLIHNMCRLPGSDGTWMIVKGGMGTVTKNLANAAVKHGATIQINNGVKKLIIEGKTIKGAVLQDGSSIKAKVVVCNADPFTMRNLIGRENLPVDYNARLDNYRRDGTTLKVNLCLSELPKFTCLKEDKGQYGTTTHILPPGEDVLEVLRKAYDDVTKGKLPEFPAIEWYTHSTVDNSIRDAQGHHNAAFFVQWVPYELSGTTWEKEEERYVKHLFSIIDKFAPNFSKSVKEYFVLTPPKLEKHFGLHRGHIHHIDNSFGFADRLPYQTPIHGLYSCSAGTHPAGSVIGCGGHNAAQRVLKDIRNGTVAVIPRSRM
mmetsp:Transcript_26743/g.37644  ORF Transcript_26743/g.37644 Transcript_26743/m.37644 type:complete len:529 (-) Transcript_26743:236-1822(-)